MSGNNKERAILAIMEANIFVNVYPHGYDNIIPCIETFPHYKVDFNALLF
jgi:hypothetical protein